MFIFVSLSTNQMKILSDNFYCLICTIHIQFFPTNNDSKIGPCKWGCKVVLSMNNLDWVTWFRLVCSEVAQWRSLGINPQGGADKQLGHSTVNKPYLPYGSLSLFNERKFHFKCFAKVISQNIINNTILRIQNKN